MEAFNTTTCPIATPIIVVRALIIAYTKCVEALKLNIGITYSLFKRRTKFITHSKDKSNEIQEKLTKFVNSHANTGILIKIGSNAKKEQNLIKRWNAALRKLFNSSAINYQTLNEWAIPPDNSIDWFVKYYKNNDNTNASSLADTSAEENIEEIFNLDKKKKEKEKKKKEKEKEKNKKDNTKEYFKSLEETVKFLEKESKNQSTNKGDDAKKDLTKLVVKTAAMMDEALIFFASTSNFETIEAMYNKLKELTAKAKLGDLNDLSKKDEQSVNEGKEAFKDILPEKIKDYYGDDKAFGSKEEQGYVKVWHTSLTKAKDNFKTNFKTYKAKIQEINKKRDEKIKDQVDLANTTRNVLRGKQEQIRGFKTIIEQNKQSIADISPHLLEDLNNFCTKCDKLLAKYGKLNNTNREAFRVCYLPADVIKGRDSARKNLYELYSYFVTISAALESGKIPSYSPSDLETKSKNVTATVDNFSDAENGIKDDDIQIPTSDSDQQSELKKKVKTLQQDHKNLMSSIEALLGSTTFGAKLLRILKSLVPFAILMLISKVSHSSSDANSLK